MEYWERVPIFCFHSSTIWADDCMVCFYQAVKASSEILEEAGAVSYSISRQQNSSFRETNSYRVKDLANARLVQNTA